METWPALRTDLQFHKVSEHPRGNHWVLYDPLRALYIELGELEILILQRWPLGSAAAIAENIARERCLAVDEQQVREFGRFAEDNDLVQSDAASLKKRLAGRARPPLQSMQRLLFWRRPLFSPDRLCLWLRPLARLTTQKYFWLATLLLAALALVSIAQHWLDYLAHLRAGWSAMGAAAFAACLILLSLFHELGHCSVARLYRIRANSVGLGLIALMPIMYSEITDAWRLPKKARLHISAAGMAFELIVAVAAALGWCLLENGPLRSACFYLFTTSLVTTLVININPLMRFDGYYLLSDITGEKNLHGTAATLLRRRLWSLFLRGQSRNSEAFPRQRRREHLLAAFGLFSLVYRTAVFAAISWAAYQLLFKAAGTLAFALSIALLLLLPAAREIAAFARHLRQLSAAGRENGKGNLFSHLRPLPLVTLLLMLGIFLVPLPWPVQLPAATYFPQQQKVVATAGGLIESIDLRPGDRISAGQVLLQLDSDELDYRIDRCRRELELLASRNSSEGFSESLDSLDGVYLADLLSKQQALRALEAQRNQLQLRAQISGTVDWRLPGIAEGEYLSVNQQVLTIVDRTGLRGRAYGRAQFIERIRTQKKGRLFISGRWRPLPVTIDGIEQIASKHIDDPVLSSAHGGPLASDGEEGDRAEEALQRVLFSLPQGAAQELSGQRPGHLVLFGEPVSLFQLSLRRIAGVFVRESGV